MSCQFENGSLLKLTRQIRAFLHEGKNVSSSCDEYDLYTTFEEDEVIFLLNSYVEENEEYYYGRIIFSKNCRIFLYETQENNLDKVFKLI